MAQDYLGNIVSHADDNEIDAINNYIHGLLSYEETLLDALKISDEATKNNIAPTPLIDAYSGILWLLSESDNDKAKSKPYIERAQNNAADLSDREKLFINFTAAWADDDLNKALSISDELIEKYPRDLLHVKLRQYIDFNLGDFPSLLKNGLIGQGAAPEIAHIHGMVSFGYEQNHLLKDAEDSAWKALELSEKEPWAQHAIAHIRLSQGRINDGQRFLTSVKHTWVGLNSFMHTHLWWHQAVFYISQGRFDDALRLYDSDVWGRDKNYSQDQISAVSLLKRLEIAGVDVGNRWQDVGDYLKTRTNDVAEPFLSLQYLIGLLKNNDIGADELLNAIITKGQTAQNKTKTAWERAAVPIAKGIIAASKGNADGAVTEFKSGLPYLNTIGGSHAQRDLFEQLLIEQLFNQSKHDFAALIELQQKLETRKAFDPYGVNLNQWLGDIYDSFGLKTQAEKSRNIAAQTLSENA